MLRIGNITMKAVRILCTAAMHDLQIKKNNVGIIMLAGIDIMP